jgi:acyl dehydratase
MSAHLLLFDDLEIGQEWESPERAVSEEDIRIFAELTGDRAAIHLDEEYAKTTPFQRRIAHGLLGLALTSGLTNGAPPVQTQVFVSLREWHFRAPIFIGDTIRVRTRVLEKELRGRGRRGLVGWGITVVNQAGRVVQEGTSTTLVERSASSREILPLAKDNRGPDSLARAG